MGYCLGVDLGTTYTAAGVWRDGRTEIVSLGNRAATIPSVVFLREDETILTGEAAERRGATEPGRLAREFKRRIGDPTPIIVGGSPYSADALTAKLLRWVVERVSEREGAAPDVVAVCHPANWGPYKQDLLGQAIRLADIGDTTTLTEPEAAAIHYAAQERVEPGSVVAVYDLGGGTFDAAVLRKADTGFELLGDPEGIERLGGVDFDEAVFAHVAGLVGDALHELDPDDATSMAAVARLRQDCVAAKEALSADTDVSIPVLLPNVQTEVRLTRSEFEAMVRPALGDSISALHRALRSAEVAPDAIDAVLLVGGSSRIPLVAQMVSSEIGRPVAIDAHPKHGIALGAAIHAHDAAPTFAAATAASEASPGSPSGTDAGATPPAAVGAVPADAPDGVQGDDGAEAVPAMTDADPIAAVPPVAPAPSPGASAEGDGGEPRSGVRRGLLIAAGVAVLAAVVVAGVMLGGGDEQPGVAATSASSDEQPTSEPDEASSDELVVDEDGESEPAVVVPPPASSPTPTSSPTPATEFVLIDQVILDGDNYRVDYRLFHFEPAIAAGQLHIHFFLDTTAHENAGTNGTPPGDWHLTDEPASFLTKYGPANRGGAEQMCAVVATEDHAVFDPESGNCVDLPVG